MEGVEIDEFASKLFWDNYNFLLFRCIDHNILLFFDAHILLVL
jgi:hypothetical protein